MPIHIIRTALGTASTKTSGTTLTTSSVNPPVGSMLIVGVAFDNAAGAPISVEWNGRLLGRRIFEDNATSGHGLGIYTKRFIHNDVTDSITVTWGSSIAAKAMFATALEGANFIDKKAGKTDLATQTPVTGPATATLATDQDFVIAAFSSKGPSTDDPGTLQIRNDGTFANASVGQRVGTTGGGPTTNVTIAEAHLELTSTTGIRARINGDAAQRRWASGLLALKQSHAFSQGITQTDIREVEAIFAGKIPELDMDNLVFQWNEELERWEAYEVTTIGTLIAHNTGAYPIKDWVEV